MRQLTKREAMELLLKGEKVDYYSTWNNELRKEERSPLRWCENLGIVDADHVEPFSKEVWLVLWSDGNVSKSDNMPLYTANTNILNRFRVLGIKKVTITKGEFDT